MSNIAVQKNLEQARRLIYGMGCALKGNYVHDALYMFWLNSSLHRHERLPKKELFALQDRLIKKQINIAYNHSRFYRRKFKEANIKPNQIKGYSDLIKMPTTSRQEVIQNYSDFIIKDAPYGIRNTSGTTGELLSIRFTKHQYFLNHLLLGRFFRRLGATHGDCVLNIHNMNSPFKFFTQLRPYDAIYLRYDQIEEALATIKSHSINIILSSPHVLELLSDRISFAKKRDFKFLISWGELVPETRKKRIEKAFNCPMYDLYGLTEMPLVAAECKKRNLHINSDVLSLEVVDDDKQVYGRRGKIVVTDLFNIWSPLIRYESGDMGALSSRTCACGSEFPVLSNLEGMLNDIILLKDGTKITPVQLMYAMYSILDAKKYQIVQTAKQRVNVLVVCDPDKFFSIQQRIKNTLRQILIGFDIHIERTKDIPLIGGPGKSKFIISLDR